MVSGYSNPLRTIHIVIWPSASPRNQPSGIRLGLDVDCGIHYRADRERSDWKVDYWLGRRSSVLFPTHLLVGYLVGRTRFRTVWVVAGAALPDLVDKPLAMVGVTRLYHSVTHSALFGFVLVAAWLIARQIEWHPLVSAVFPFAVGWASHLAADALHITINGRPGNTVFLLWPLVPTWDSIEASPVPFVFQYLWTPSFYLEVGIWLLAAFVLLRDRLTDHRLRRV